MDYNVKRLSDYSEESLINDIRRVAKKLGKDTITSKEYEKHSKAGVTTIIRRLGSWNSALKKAGLSVKNLQNIPIEELFAEIDRIWNQLGKQPTRDEMDQLSKYSVSTFDNRFGGWTKAAEEFVKWKSQNNNNDFTELAEITPEILLSQPKKSQKTKKVEYGEPIDFLGLRHAPLNEQGVVYLFGILSKQLGFIIEAIRTDFPDCEGKRQIPGKKGRWERVSIEFEYKSSNFREHGHSSDECDVIVCWENDWNDCPIEVISLKEIMIKIKEKGK